VLFTTYSTTARFSWGISILTIPDIFEGWSSTNIINQQGAELPRHVQRWYFQVLLLQFSLCVKDEL